MCQVVDLALEQPPERREILVADEPTGDLDKSSAHAVMQLLQSLNRELDKTIIMVTHDPKTTDYAKRTLHLDKGQLVEQGAAEEALA